MPNYTFFNPRPRVHRKSLKLQRKVSHLFDKVSDLRFEHVKASNAFAEQKAESRAYIQSHEGVQILQDTADNAVYARKVMIVKWAAIGLDGMVSVPAANLFLGLAIGISPPPLILVVIGTILAYLLMKAAIFLAAYADRQVPNNVFGERTYRYGFFIVLSIVPLLSLIQICINEADAGTVFWVVVMLLAFGMNYLAASYASQYMIAEQSEVYKKKLEGFKHNADKYVDIINKTLAKLRELENQIRPVVAELYLSFVDNEGSPPIPNIIPAPYCIVINNRYMGYPFLPVTELSIVEHLGTAGELDRFIRDGRNPQTASDIARIQNRELMGLVEESANQPPPSPPPSAGPQSTPPPPPTNNDNGANQTGAHSTPLPDDAPGFDRMFSNDNSTV